MFNFFLNPHWPHLVDKILFLGNGYEKSLYINTDTFRKSDRKSRSSLSQESENLNSNTFTKSSKPKRVESLIKRFDMSFWRRNKEPKEKSPSPSGSDTIKRSKNIFNTLISSGKKSTRDVGIECKMDEDRDYYSGMGTRKSSIQSLIPERRHHRPLKISKRNEQGSNQQLTSIIKPPERRYPYEKKSMTAAPAPIRVVDSGVRNTNKYSSDMESKRKPIGIASPLPPARNRSVLKNATAKTYENKRPEINAARSYAPTRVQETSNFNRQGSDRASFREYREKLKLKNDGRRITDNSDDELRQSYQQSFFIPMWSIAWMSKDIDRLRTCCKMIKSDRKIKDVLKKEFMSHMHACKKIIFLPYVTFALYNNDDHTKEDFFDS